MKTTCKFCWGLSALLVVAIVGIGYTFFVKGNVTASDDGRTAIMLSAGERDFVLAEMRAFLEAIETITVAIGENDMATAAESAHKMGMIETVGTPPSFVTKLPMEFRTLGSATHKAFDDLAMEAQDMGNEKIVLGKLGSLISNCTSCHASYSFGVEDSYSFGVEDNE